MFTNQIEKMEYKFNQRPNTTFTPEALSLIEAIKTSEYSVLVGRNDCGKSYLLKTINEKIGSTAMYLAPARHYNFNALNYYSENINKTSQRHQNFLQQWRQQFQNYDNSQVDLSTAISELSDPQRNKLFDIVEILLHTRLEIALAIPNNEMSQKYISCNGYNISYTSSGFRLITTLVTCMLDTDYDTYLIDEPELGISPEAQGVLADFLFSREHRKKYFSHIKCLIFATHSTIFLDRLNISNNYAIEKHEDFINIKKITTINEFNNIHFFLLGNRLETLFLPSCIILTEGYCDQRYISRIVELKFPGFQFSVINATSDSRIKEVLYITGNIFGDLQKSPYRTRIIVVLDEIHEKSIGPALENIGLSKENIIVWKNNGIEYYYPVDILKSIYNEPYELSIVGDDVSNSKNEITYKKSVLCDKVIQKMNNATVYPDEVKNILIQRIESIINPVNN